MSNICFEDSGDLELSFLYSGVRPMKTIFSRLAFRRVSLNKEKNEVQDFRLVMLLLGN